METTEDRAAAATTRATAAEDRADASESLLTSANHNYEARLADADARLEKASKDADTFEHRALTFEAKSTDLQNRLAKAEKSIMEKVKTYHELTEMLRLANLTRQAADEQHEAELVDTKTALEAMTDECDCLTAELTQVKHAQSSSDELLRDTMDRLGLALLEVKNLQRDLNLSQEATERHAATLLKEETRNKRDIQQLRHHQDDAIEHNVDSCLICCCKVSTYKTTTCDHYICCAECSDELMNNTCSSTPQQEEID